MLQEINQAAQQAIQSPAVRVPADTVALGSIVATIAGYLPYFAALMSGLYYAWLLYVSIKQYKKSKG